MRVPTVGTVIEVTITLLEPYGAWVERDGCSGLVVIPEVSWSRICHPGDVLEVGQRVKVKVLVVSPDSTISASIRQVHPEQNPWVEPDRFAVGTEFTAPVVRVLEYGSFVELRPEVWGLLKRELWAGPLAVGDVIRVRVVRSDSVSRKVEIHLA